MVPQDVIDKAKAEHGEDLRILSSEAGGGIEILVRKPNRAEWKRFRAQSAEKNTRDVASENLFRAVVLYPGKQEISNLLDNLPGIVEEFAEHLLELVGITTESESRKP